MWEINAHVHRVGVKMIFIVWTVIILSICTYTDIKGKYIYTWICGLNALVAIVVHALLKDIPIRNIGLGLLIGVVAFIVSIVTKEKLGRGDAWVIVTIGTLEGIMFILPTLIWKCVSKK